MYLYAVSIKLFSKIKKLEKVRNLEIISRKLCYKNFYLFYFIFSGKQTLLKI